MGFNLTDRLILAGDTKLSNSSTKETVGYCIKVLQFHDKEEKNFVSCAFAGNKNFVVFLAEKIRNGLESGALDSDINWLVENIDIFFKKVVPEFNGGEKAKNTFLIFGGVSKNPAILKPFDQEMFSEIFGPGGGRVDDENLLFAMQTGFVALPTREQKIFSYVINPSQNIFGVRKVGGVYSFLFAGSTIIEEDVQKEIRRIFLDKRSIEAEAKDVINLLRSKYSETIGGAITIGVIDSKGILRYLGYELNRSGETHETNWYIKFGDKIIGTGPNGEEYDLVRGFFEDSPTLLSLNLEL